MNIPLKKFRGYSSKYSAGASKVRRVFVLPLLSISCSWFQIASSLIHLSFNSPNNVAIHPLYSMNIIHQPLVKSTNLKRQHTVKEHLQNWTSKAHYTSALLRSASNNRPKMGFDVIPCKISLADTCTCIICSMILEDPLSSSSCGHKFCTKCIHKWLENHDSCPYCRKPLDTCQLRMEYGIDSKIRSSWYFCRYRKYIDYRGDLGIANRFHDPSLNGHDIICDLTLTPLRSRRLPPSFDTIWDHGSCWTL